MTERLAIIQNIPSRALAQLVGFDFNSFARMEDGRVFAGSEAGLFELGGGNDFAGTDIDAQVDLYLPLGQRMDLFALIISLETSGNMLAVVTFDDQALNQVSLALDPFQTGNRQHATKFYLSGYDCGDYIRLSLRNVDGADFGLDYIQADVVPLGARGVE